MAGAQKDRLAKERERANSAHDSSSQVSSQVSSSDNYDPAIATFDGNRDPGGESMSRNPITALDVKESPKLNFDLGMAGWHMVRNTPVITNLPPRPALSKLGQGVKIGLNSFHVAEFPEKEVYQFDVSIGNGDEKRGLCMAVFNSKVVRSAVGPACLFDGKKLAWSTTPITREIRLSVNLDEERGKKPGKLSKKPDEHRIVIRQTAKVRFETLMHHLQGKAPFDSKCLEAITFADHLLRETPSLKYTAIKRAFFKKGETRFDLGGGIEAFKGVYQSLRLVHPGRLSINLDVANGTFWTAQRFMKTAQLVTSARSDADLTVLLGDGPKSEKSRAGQEMKRLRKIHVIANHRGKEEADHYVIDRFLYVSAKVYKFNVTDEAGQKTAVTIFDYFKNKFGIRLQYPELPLVKMTKGENTVLPMEVLRVKENQRYPYKMDERQTSNMIKFAVTPPPERWAAIEHGLTMLDWANDPVLKHHGMKISKTKTIADGRLLPAPTVKFGSGEAKPGTSGRWDLKGKKFLTGNPVPLKSWTVCCVSGRRGGKPDKSVVERFVSEFIKGYQGLGGRVENKTPVMMSVSGDDAAAWVMEAWNLGGKQSQMNPQILMFILPDRDSLVYGRIKRSCDCRYGVVSQCVQYAQVQKCQPQYIANVCMKFNAKLGGSTCKAVGPKTPNGHFSVATMVIGADVSHGAPGAQIPSMAAMTVSMDRLATRYAAVCQSNGFRVEMISPKVIHKDLAPMFQKWMENVGGGQVPKVVMYLRDGVSEGQYAQVLEEEVREMKSAFKQWDPAGKIKFVVVVGSKRHHIRFFPERGDRNGNAHPGTLVETGCTNPFENDFYLQSHAAIKGTARPCHYYVLSNEADMTNDQLQTMLYEQAYQYARASTPISQHPAIYYAHLAALRAAPHDPKWAGSDPHARNKQPGIPNPADKLPSITKSGDHKIDCDDLLEMPPKNGIKTAMWYI